MNLRDCGINKNIVGMQDNLRVTFMRPYFLFRLASWNVFKRSFVLIFCELFFQRRGKSVKILRAKSEP